MNSNTRTATTAHTPGPWAIYGIGSDGSFEVWCRRDDSPSGEFVVCSRNPIEHRADESKANAALIAAAPELLDVLKRFSEFPFTHQGPAEGPLAVMLDQARAAIAKAVGETA